MRALPLGPSVELPISHETYEGCAESDRGTACGRCRLGLLWSSPTSHETCEGSAKRVKDVPREEEGEEEQEGGGQVWRRRVNFGGS